MGALHIFKTLPLKDRHAGCSRCNYVGCGWAREVHGERFGHWFWVLEFYWGNIKTALNPTRLYEFFTALDYSQIEVLDMEINTKDAPDFCDSYITEANYKGRPMTEDELDLLNQDSDFVYSQVEKRVY